MAGWKPFKFNLEFPKAGGDSLESPWIFVIDTFDKVDPDDEAFDHLLIKASGEWAMLPGLDATCGPDGRADVPLASGSRLLSSCQPGALIGKIGGSSASLDEPASAMKPVGGAEGAEGAEGTQAGEGGGGADEATGQPGLFAIGKACMVPLLNLPRGPLFIGINISLRPLRVLSLKLEISGAKLD